MNVDRSHNRGLVRDDGRIRYCIRGNLRSAARLLGTMTTIAAIERTFLMITPSAKEDTAAIVATPYSDLV
jgi:hypothetical protein